MKRASKGDVIFDSIKWIFLAVVVFVTLYPFYYVLIQSLSQGMSALTDNVIFYPKKLTLENYIPFFTDEKWKTAIFISVFRTVTGTAIGLMFTCLVSYSLSFKDLAFRKFYFTILIISMYFSGGIIPYYMLLKNLNLFNTFLVYIIPGALNIFFVMVGISFFREIPQELFDSAHVDGANDFIIFWKLVLPVSKPFLATIALFLGVEHWNAWFDSAFFVQKPELKTLSFLMMQIVNKNQISGSVSAGAAAYKSSMITSFSLQSAAMIIAVLPIICVYPFLQKYFVKGMMIGSVKG
ncbi:carbohydrate ABC transporter permease [Ruminiclostridium cellobioparum]|uniref:ABC-type sugar transport system, permease component n=1 Tax=Ruminiclostridium cellobioparum subsp. termitidis CT1112 TaxID=1195236 RepID=S0FKM2_RUMCE|nr:carbohydrate ABC transporter permease [Ruminiclostridium cellobioparum]EMS72402.1 ABC-type sugar transport system, permease component [Ruminiclostridium cellobioparum subsp. termitidis CT1112]